jgi:cytidylate kinase
VRDAGRAVAPLKPAADAVTIDSTGIPIDDVVAQVLALVRSGGQRVTEVGSS